MLKLFSEIMQTPETTKNIFYLFVPEMNSTTLLSTDYGRPMKLFFNDILNFWAWTQCGGFTCMGVHVKLPP